MRSVVLVLLGLLATGCGSSPTDSLNLRGSEALVVRNGSVQAVPLDGGPVRSLMPSSALWCATDARAQVLYLLEKEAGSQTRQLRVVDLKGGAQAFTVLRHLPKADLMLIEHPGYGVLNEPKAVSFRVASVLQLGPEPRITSRLGCTGDDRYLCEEGLSKDKVTLKNSVKTLQAQIAATPIDNKPLLQAVHRRSGRRAMWLEPPPGAKLPRVRVPLDKCADKKKCEVASPIPGTRYWSVVTETEPTGVFEETLSWRQFFDPKTGHFFDPAKPDSRSQEPLDASARISRLIVSPSGQAFMSYGEVVHLERGLMVDGALPCGFVDGGWVVGGWPFN